MNSNSRVLTKTDKLFSYYRRWDELGRVKIYLSSHHQEVVELGFEPGFDAQACALSHYAIPPPWPGSGFLLSHFLEVNPWVSYSQSLSFRVCVSKNMDIWWVLVTYDLVLVSCSSFWSLFGGLQPPTTLPHRVSPWPPLDLAPFLLQWASCCPWGASNPTHRGTPEPQGQPGEDDPGKEPLQDPALWGLGQVLFERCGAGEQRGGPAQQSPHRPTTSQEPGDSQGQKHHDVTHSLRAGTAPWLQKQ